MVFSLWRHRRRPKRNDSPVSEELVGLLEPGVELEGIMRVSDGLVRVNNHFKGSIKSQGSVVVAGQGEVEGEVRAKLVAVLGKVKGAVHASERIEIREQGVVLGDLFAPSLIVDPGAYFDGRCHMPSPLPATREPQLK